MCATVRAPLHSEQASGNMGGLCYSSWRGIAVVRSAWSGTYPGTAKQLTVQGRITTLSQYWGITLTALQRTKWNELADQIVFKNKLGQSYRPNGYNVFIQRNVQRLRMGHATAQVPVPGNGAIDDSVSYVETDLVGTAITCYLNNYAGLVISANAWEVWVAGPFDTESRNAIDPEYKYETHGHGVTSLTTSPLTQGKWYWVRLRWNDIDGRTGNWHRHQHFLPV